MSSVSPTFDAPLLRKLGRPGPRYTSYPTADRFQNAFGYRDYLAAVAHRRTRQSGTPLSLYVHIPFCASICYYCACNKIVTRKRDKAAVYLDYLKREISMQAALYDGMNRVDQLHLGGGTPTYLSDAQMDELMAHLRSHFQFAPDAVGEYAIEIDPRTVTVARIASLRRQGFNRLSLGVQDFDERVQRAVNRIQPEVQTQAIIDAARAHGFRSVNIDLIYGLPLQTPETMATTLERVIAADPDRILESVGVSLARRGRVAGDGQQFGGVSARCGLVGRGIIGGGRPLRAAFAHGREIQPVDLAPGVAVEAPP